MTETQDIKTIAARFVEDLETKFRHEQAERFATLKLPTLSIEAGRVYDRIVIDSGYDYGRSVHAFLTKDGKLIKAAGWKAPQKDSKGKLAVRFDISTPEGYAEALAAADAHGSYLYAR